jgi:aminopeptidase-like protein
LATAGLRPRSADAPELPYSATGAEIFELAREIFPICRSITGDGVRETLGILARHLPLERR